MKHLLSIYCFVALFLSGSSFLSFVGWPTYGEGYRYPGPSFFFLIIMAFVCIVRQSKLSKFNYEFVGLLLLVAILLFNKSTGRDVPLKAAAIGLFTPFLLSISIKQLGKNANRSFLTNTFVFFFIINSLLALFEQVTHIYVLGTKEALGGNSFGFRSHALLGHPLSNSTFTAILMCFFF